MIEQSVWRENPAKKGDEQGVGVFVRYDGADEQIVAADQHWGAGFLWTGLAPTRDEDQLGLAVHWVHFSDERGAGFVEDAETNIELMYRVKVTGYLSTTFDLQYVMDPGGGGLEDAMVGTVRVELAF